MIGVAIAGALGAVCRVLVDSAVRRRAGGPWAVAVVNVLGCLGAGSVLGALFRGGVPLDLPATAGTGFLGAFTTFSGWTVEALQTAAAGRRAGAAALVAGSVIAGLVAAVVGFAVVAA